MHKAAIQLGHVNLLRSILGLRKSTPHVVVYSESGDSPIAYQWLCRAVSFWNNLCAQDLSSIFRAIWLAEAQYAIQYESGWAYGLLRALRSVGMAPLPDLQNLGLIDVDVVRQLCHTRLANAYSPAICASPSPRGFQSSGVILCTYFHWFRKPSRSFSRCMPIDLDLPAKVVRCFIRFRSGCSNLPIDLGRRNRVPRCNRFCPACSPNVLCDEYHVIFECEALTALRVKFRQLFTLGTATMQTFMWQKDIRRVAQFVTEALDIVLA